MRLSPLTLSTLIGGALLIFAPGATAADRDRDGLPDRWEREHRVKKAGADHDRDGLENLGEYLSRTNPRRRDSDRDRRPDGREDRDRDGLTNRDEMRFGWHPRKRDTDGDRRPDGRENSGVVVSVQGLNVTIRLAAGGRLSAPVTDASALSCAVRSAVGPVGGAGSGSAGAPIDAAEAEGFWDPTWGDRPTDLDAEDEQDAEAPVFDHASQADEGDEDGAEDEGGEEETIDAEQDAADPECAASLRTGALVHQATTEAGLINWLELVV